MKQIIIPKFGGTNVFQVREVADPMPRKGEVRIDVRASGVNFADVLARQGLYPDAPKPLPIVVGYEVSGVIDAIGEGVDEARLGEEVLAITRFNGYADKVVVPHVAAFPKPSSLSFEQAAGIPVNYLTAWQLLVVMGSLQAHETVLIHNIGGGVGLAAIDIAQHIGATIMGTASKGKHEFLHQRGVHNCIDYRTENWHQRVMDLTDGLGVELITDPIGGKSWKDSYRTLRHTGRLGMFGISVASESKLWGALRLLKVVTQMPIYFPLGLLDGNRGVFGVNLGHLWHEQPKVKIWMDTILQGVADGWVRPHVDKSFPLEAVGEAHAYLEARKNIGKVVLIP